MGILELVKSGVRPEHFVSALETDSAQTPAEEDIFINQPEPANTNVGSLSPISSGTPTDPDMDVRVELVAGGSLGTSAFKYSRDGGSNWLGRGTTSAVDVATGMGDTRQLTGVVSPSLNIIVATQQNLGNFKVGYVRSADGGATWGAVTDLETFTQGYQITNPIVLPSGRIMALAADTKYYSDDGGVTWDSESSDAWPDYGMTLLALEGMLILWWPDDITLDYKTSIDEGRTWTNQGTAFTAAAAVFNFPASVVTSTGRIVVAYIRTSAAVEKVYTRVSDDGGISWGAEVLAIDEHVLSCPDGAGARLAMFVDAGDTIYLAAIQDAAQNLIRQVYSVSSGDSWQGLATWRDAGAGKTVDTIAAVLVNGISHGLIYRDTVDNDMVFYKSTDEKAYTQAADAVPCGRLGLTQYLGNGISIFWRGYPGVLGDSWAFTPGYHLGGGNLLEESAQAPWRTPLDNVEVEHITDLGAKRATLIDYLALFGANGIESISAELSNDDSSDTESATLSFVKLTGTAEADPTNGAIYTPTMLSGIQDHELAGLFLKLVSGTSGGSRNGYCYRIRDNVGGWLFVDDDDMDDYVLNTTSLKVLSDRASVAVTGRPYRYVILTITAQRTPDGYYSLRWLVAGRALQPLAGPAEGSTKEVVPNLVIGEMPAGQRRSWRKGEVRHSFDYVWPSSAASARDELRHLFEFCDFGNTVLALIPDSDVPQDCYPVRLVSGFTETMQTASVGKVVRLRFEEELL